MYQWLLCRNNPYLNGGTCKEICEPTSVRYSCSCPEPFVGKHCEIQLRRSCQDYKAAASSKSGLYKVEDDSNRTFQVFCDFDSEPGFAWNLIESFSLSNRLLFQVTVKKNYLYQSQKNLLSLCSSAIIIAFNCHMAYSWIWGENHCYFCP